MAQAARRTDSDVSGVVDDGGSGSGVWDAGPGMRGVAAMVVSETQATRLGSHGPSQGRFMVGWVSSSL
ncbi:MAG: hypothetical protein ACK4IT_05080 [Thioalkalivibrionaceae bacterium]